MGFSGTCGILGINLLVDHSETTKQLPSTTTPKDTIEKNDLDKLVEDKRIYESEKEDPIINLYVTAVQSTSGKNDSLYHLNHWYDLNSITSDSPRLDVIVQEGDEKGPKDKEIKTKGNTPNATMEIRGNSSRTSTQKSYKIKLLDSTGLWRGQKTLNLNKHSTDLTRIRNKLSFDYYKVIPNMTSLRTQFVHLYIKDLTAGEGESQFVDYGLYTHVEQVNERFLASRGLDSNGNLYKAINFEFFRYPSQLKLADDKKYNKESFESILEIKGSEDHTKLLKMLDDVNNLSLNINDVFNHYFDRDNYLTWMATNILFGNKDTLSQNFYLYSPLNSEKWFFLPWDYDGAWDWYNDREENKRTISEWQTGLSSYWGVVLHKRYFKDPENVKALNEKIESLSKIITKQKTKELLDQYYPIVKPFITSQPDINFLPTNVDRFDSIYRSLVNVPEKNKQEYYRTLENPMPIFLDQKKVSNGTYTFHWDYSYDLQGDDLTYDFQLAKDPSFSTIVKQKKNMTRTKMVVKGLTPGPYYWRVIVKDSQGHQQIAFDNYENEDGLIYHGVKEFIVR